MDMRARSALAALGVVAYAVVSHTLMTRAADSPLTLAVILGPMAFAFVASTWQLGRRVLAVLLAAGVVAGAAASTLGDGVSPELLYFAQHAGMHAALAIGFGLTLRAGQVSLITRLATRVHAGHVPPTMQAYTRRLTRAWSIYFTAVAAASCALFVFGPFAWWSLFANVLTPVSLGIMFIGEYLLRYRLHPEFERVSIATMIRAFSQRSAPNAAGPQPP